MSVAFSQKGIDFSVSLIDSQNHKVLELDSPNGKFGPELLYFVAPSSGDYKLEIHAAEDYQKGLYSVQLRALRDSTDQDQRLLAAQQACIQAVPLILKGTEESQRESITKYEEALQYFEQAGDSYGAATTYSNIGLMYAVVGDNRKSVEYHKLALPGLEANGDLYYKAVTLEYIGIGLSRLGDKREALDQLKESLAVRRAVKDRLGEAVTVTDIATVYSDLGNTQLAIEYYDRAVEIFRLFDDKSSLATALTNLGLAYFSIGANQKALNYYLESLKSRRVLDDKIREAGTLRAMALIYAKTGDSRTALNYYDQALAIYYNRDVKQGVARTLSDIGLLYSLIGDSQKSLDFLNKAFRIQLEIGEKSGQGTTLSNIGFVEARQGHTQEAIKNYLQSISCSRASTDARQEAVTLSRLQDLLTSSNAIETAIFFGKEAVNKYQQLREGIKNLDKLTRDGYVQTIQATYRKLASNLVSKGRITEAEQILRMLKEDEAFTYVSRDDKVARELLQTVSLNDKERQALTRYEVLADQITRIGKEFEGLDIKRRNFNKEEEFPDQAHYDELKRQLSDAVTAFQVFLEQLKLKLGQGDVRVAQVAASDMRSILRKLGERRTAIVSTIVDKDRLNIIVTTSSVQRAHTIPVTEKDVNRMVIAFREALGDPSTDPRPISQELYNVLIGHIQSDLDGIRANTIVWSLDGTLRYIPMAALWDKEKGYVAERYASVVLTYASMNRLLEPVSDTQNWTGLGVGVSKAVDGFKALAAVPEELDCIITDTETNSPLSPASGCLTGVLPGKKLLDDKFTLSAFERLLGKYPVVHIASHFSLNPGNENDSFILLGGGDVKRFTVEDLRGIALSDLELIVLSACSTAASGGEKANGLEVEGFGAIAQMQGAKSVLASLWSVADESTRNLMIKFYKTYDDGRARGGKAEALRQAQLSLLYGESEKPLDKKPGVKSMPHPSGGKQQVGSNPPYSHPFYWSPFILMGNWR